MSHGCVNVSPANARWLFDQTKVGDPVTVKGTERKLAHGNGWTAWNLSWDEFVKGSALPVPPDLVTTGRRPRRRALDADGIETGDSTTKPGVLEEDRPGRSGY